MSQSAIPIVEAAAFAALEAATWPEGVQVVEEFPGARQRPQCVYVQRAYSERETPAGLGRNQVRRDVDVVVEIAVEVLERHNDLAAAKTSMWALNAIVRDALLTDVSLGGVFVLPMNIGRETPTYGYLDTGAIARVVIEVEGTARPTVP